MQRVTSRADHVVAAASLDGLARYEQRSGPAGSLARRGAAPTCRPRARNRVTWPGAHCNGRSLRCADSMFFAEPLQLRLFIHHYVSSGTPAMSQLSWFTEAHQASGSSIGYRVEKLLHAEKTP